MADRMGQRFGDYRLTRFLGRGSFGDVYLGEHVQDKTLAAVKVLQARLTNEDLKEFINETSTVFRMKHPHIVQLLDFGIGADDTPFLAMDYAPNGTLRQRYPKGTRLPLENIVTYIKQIAAALQYAHDKRRVHRDIKPDNILLGSNDEVLLSDFGIASVAHGTQSLDTHKEAGTIPYMAPEQLQGKPRPASDQYALGIIVYEWLCGERPFNGAYWEIVSQHLSTPPPSFKKELMISSEVEQVVMTALAKDPHQRFESVQAFANALEKACRPKPPIGATLLTYRGHVGGANSVAWSPDGSRIASGSDDGTVQVWDAATGATLLIYDDRPSYRPSYVKAVAWSSDGLYIASDEYGDGGRMQIRNATTGDVRNLYCRFSTVVTLMACSPDGKHIAFVAASYGGSCPEDADWIEDGEVKVCNINADSIVLRYHHTYLLKYYSEQEDTDISEEREDAVVSLSWSPDGKHIASAGESGVIQIWNVTTRLQAVAFHSDGVATALAWSPDGTRIASASNEVVQIWDAANGRHLLTYTSPYGSSTEITPITALAWSPDGKQIASASGSYAVCISQDGNSSARGGRDAGPPVISHRIKGSTVQIWDTISAHHIFIYHGHSEDVEAVAWSPDGTRIASSSHDKTVHVWQAV